MATREDINFGLQGAAAGFFEMSRQQMLALIILNGLVSNRYSITEKPEVLIRRAYMLAELFDKGEELVKEYREAQLPEPPEPVKQEEA